MSGLLVVVIDIPCVPRGALCILLYGAKSQRIPKYYCPYFPSEAY